MKIMPRTKRHRRIRKKVSGTNDRPRLSVYRSIKNIYAQLIDDENNVTLLSCSSQDKELRGKVKGGDSESAARLGELVAKRARERGIEQVVFDRGGYVYHGRIKALAEAARSNGLKF